MRMYSDSQSYEDFMDEIETTENIISKGWHAKYQPRCDCCGRFVIPESPGSSWVNVPYSDVSMGDERERCASCTKKHGPAKAMPEYVKHLVQGVVADA